MSPRWLYFPAAGGTPWKPDDLSNLVVWLDADDTSFNNLDAVDAWTNKGSSGNTAQSDSTKRPVFKTNLLNGKPGVDFDGSNDCLRITSLALDTFMSMFIVAKATTAKPFFIEHGPSVGTSAGMYFYGSSGNHYFVRRGSATNGFAGTSGWFGTAAAQACLIIDTAATNNPMGKVYKDGTLQADGTLAAGSSLSDSSLTDTLNIGARNNGASVAMDCELHELIVYNEPLAFADREKVEGYLAHKWGLDSNLPSTHPYKSSAP